MRKEVKMSTQFTLNLKDWKRIGIHLVIVAVAAGLTAVLQALDPSQFGSYGVFLVPVISFVLKTAVLYLQGK
jgi:hypothetical protein